MKERIRVDRRKRLASGKADYRQGRLGRQPAEQLSEGAAFVAGLEVVAVHVHDRAIGQVAEGAADRVRARVANERVGCACFQTPFGRTCMVTFAPLLIVTPLAITLSVFACFPLALKV